MPGKPTDEQVQSSVYLTSVLRAWLRARRESPQEQLGALAYETAALIARQATTEAQALALVDAWATVMKDQVRRLGVGHEHP